MDLKYTSPDEISSQLFSARIRRQKITHIVADNCPEVISDLHAVKAIEAAGVQMNESLPVHYTLHTNERAERFLVIMQAEPNEEPRPGEGWPFP